jgi:hypothetical protein
MSIRSDFEQILNQYGHDVYLQRAHLSPDCNEMIYSNSLEKRTTRYSVGIHRNLPRSGEEAIEGVLNTTDRSYYFTHEVNPFEGDRIYDYLERADGNQEVYLIQSTVAMRGEDGHIAFWVAGATRIYPN